MPGHRPHDAVEPPPSQPLHELHRRLLPHIQHMQVLADQVGELSVPELRHGLGQVDAFLRRRLQPHAIAEDRVLYPLMQRLFGAPDLMRLMSRDHRSVDRLTDQLAELRQAIADAPPSREQTVALRRVLYELYAVVKLHFAKEEEILLPLLDERLEAAAWPDLLRQLHDVAGQADGPPPLQP